MKQTLFQEKYPVFSLEVEKSETAFQTTDEIIGFFKNQIDQHRIARFIATFDHYAHTKSLEEGRINKKIIDAKNIIFCFGITLPEPQSMAVRPRSIGVVELSDHFIITFMEAPMPLANIAMEKWAGSIRNLPED